MLRQWQHLKISDGDRDSVGSIAQPVAEDLTFTPSAGDVRCSLPPDLVVGLINGRQSVDIREFAELSDSGVDNAEEHAKRVPHPRVEDGLPFPTANEEGAADAYARACERACNRDRFANERIHSWMITKGPDVADPIASRDLDAGKAVVRGGAWRGRSEGGKALAVPPWLELSQPSSEASMWDGAKSDPEGPGSDSTRGPHATNWARHTVT